MKFSGDSDELAAKLREHVRPVGMELAPKHGGLGTIIARTDATIAPIAAMVARAGTIRPGVPDWWLVRSLHALLFTGHVHALAGRPAEALDSFARYTEAVERRHVPRFAGRGVNFTGWVLRNIGAADEAVERHLEALEFAGRDGGTELAIAAIEDLAEDRIERGDLDDAAGRLAEAESMLRGDLVFGWRLELKLRLLRGRLALASGECERALGIADELAAAANAIDVPRYTSVARLLAHRARSRLGLPVDLVAVQSDLDLLDQSVAVEAWWWTGETAADLHVPRWVDRAADRVAELARFAGSREAGLQAEAARRLDGWRVAAG